MRGYRVIIATTVVGALLAGSVSGASARWFHHRGRGAGPGVVGGLFVGAATIATLPLALLAEAARSGAQRYDQDEESGPSTSAPRASRQYGYGYGPNYSSDPGYGYGPPPENGYSRQQSYAYGPPQGYTYPPQQYYGPPPGYEYGPPPPRYGYGPPPGYGDYGYDR
jgi:hypothetical protein